MKVPKSITKLIENFQSLPGIGPKSAQRITFHLLHYPQEYLDRFSKTLLELKQGTQLCEVCKNVGEETVCSVCGDQLRDHSKILVVSHPMDTFAVEKTGFDGVYHVLHGVIDPLNGIGPDELFINDLLDRVETAVSDLSIENKSLEIILATNTSMEGESTAMYISKMIKERGIGKDRVRITRIARGLPVGGDIEYADDITLSRALEGRLEF